MQYNLAHSSPEVVNGYLCYFGTERIDAVTQDMWGIGSVFLSTLTQRTWFMPDYAAGIREVAAGVQALHEDWVSLCKHMHIVGKLLSCSCFSCRAFLLAWQCPGA